MTKSNFSRRDFNRLAAAALGGIATGALVGCSDAKTTDKDGKEKEKDGKDKNEGEADGSAARGDADKDADKPDLAIMLEGKHVCRGLNTCKTDMNECAGTGACATAEKHTCHKDNKCKGEGGCGEFPGANQCSGKGECGVPLGDGAWKKARANFEKIMTEKEKKFGDAPPAAPKTDG
jgi:hypothetical protein